jgi:hypothetical protein
MIGVVQIVSSMQLQLLWSTELEKEDSLHYPIWFCNYWFHGRYRSQWIHLKMIFHESIDATFLFLAGTSDDRIRTLLLDERNGRSILTMSSSF